jgi:hypothetical protein
MRLAVAAQFREAPSSRVTRRPLPQAAAEATCELTVVCQSSTAPLSAYDLTCRFTSSPLGSSSGLCNQGVSQLTGPSRDAAFPLVGFGTDVVSSSNDNTSATSSSPSSRSEARWTAVALGKRGPAERSSFRGQRLRARTTDGGPLTSHFHELAHARCDEVLTGRSPRYRVGAVQQPAWGRRGREPTTSSEQTQSPRGVAWFHP